VALRDQRSVEGQDLVDEPTLLVAVVDHDRRDADVNPEHLEMQVRDALQTLDPVAAKGGLAPDDVVSAVE